MKAFGNVKNKVLGKKAETQDAEFDGMRIRFNELSENQYIIYKDLVKQDECIRAVGIPTVTLADNMRKVFGDSHTLSINYGNAATTMEMRIREYAERHREVLVNLGSYVAKFKDMKQRLTDRDNTLIDYETANKELETLRSKPVPDALKIEAAEGRADNRKGVYEAANHRAFTELKEYIENRQNLFDTHVHAISLSQAELFRSLNSLMIALTTTPEFTSIPVPDAINLQSSTIQNNSYAPQPAAPNPFDPKPQPNPFEPQAGANPFEPQSSGSPAGRPQVPAKPSRLSSPPNAHAPPAYAAPEQSFAPPQPAYSNPYAPPQPAFQTAPEPSYQQPSSGFGAYTPFPAPSNDPFAVDPFATQAAPSLTKGPAPLAKTPSSGSHQMPSLVKVPSGSQPPVPQKPSPPAQHAKQPAPPARPPAKSIEHAVGRAAGDAVANAALDPENQKKAGKAVSAQANDPAAQAKVGQQIANNSSNPFVKSMATNSTLQKFGGKAVGKAAENEALQKKAGQAVADQAQNEENQAKMTGGIKGGFSSATK